jgi:hypothetical protein
VVVATLNNWIDVIAVLDALMSQIIYKFHNDDFVRSFASFQREDCVLVVTGDYKGKIRIRLADSGEIIGQWQASLDFESDVAIAFKAGEVIGAYGRSGGGLWIWSFGEEEPCLGERNIPAINYRWTGGSSN